MIPEGTRGQGFKDSSDTKLRADMNLKNQSKKMTSQERFRETMRFGVVDRVPYFEEGIREEVLQAWRKQGLPPGSDLNQLFPSDQRREIILDLEPRPEFDRWPASKTDLNEMRKRLDPDDPGRLPENWPDFVNTSRDDGNVKMLRVHRGLFLSMGIRDWQRFKEVIDLIIDYPEFVREAMLIQGRFSARLAERVLQQIKVDAAIFSEPIGGNDKPLISPEMYEDLVLKSYKPLFDVLSRNGINTLIFRTFANSRILIPSILKWGFNCLWACEVNIEAMDYRSIRREFGRDLRLIGGIDLDALRRGKAAIQREVMEKVPPLLAEGGYIPLADGRVREDVQFESYSYYRELLKMIIEG